MDCAPDTTFNLAKLKVANKVLLLKTLYAPRLIKFNFLFTVSA